MSVAEVIADAYYRFVGGSTDVRRHPGREIQRALKAAGYVVVNAEHYRVARKGLVDLTEAWAELRMDTPQDQELHDRLVGVSRVSAALLPEVADA